MNNIKSLGVLGSPLEHSKSPLLFNALFYHYNIHAHYNKIEEMDIKKAFNIIRDQNYVGISVTIPHKQSALKYMDELDELSEKIGCINTIISHNGQLKGYNFDGIGACDALLEQVPDLSKEKILFIGMGGAARGIALTMSILYGVKHFLFISRNPSKYLLLTQDLKKRGAEVETYSDIDGLNQNKKEVTMILNTTPLGLQTSDALPLDPSFLSENMTIFDVIYNPKKTPLLKEAEKRGANIVYGESMFINQAKKQFKTWFNIEPDNELMERFLYT